MASAWESLEDKLIDQGLATILTPAFAFWSGGLAIVVGKKLGWRNALAWIDAQKLSSQVLGLLGLLLLLGVSTYVIERLSLPVLRFLEGYWPRFLSPLTKGILKIRAWRIDRLSSRFAWLQRKYETLTGEELHEYRELEARLLWVPSETADLMPTRLGDVLRTAERRPRLKYGLDGVLCWPRLWLVLPSLTREELKTARAGLNAAAQLWSWGALFCLWAIFSWWALPIGLGVAAFAYRNAVDAALLYGELMDSAYDLYRREIYSALRWPMPGNPSEERELGNSLTSYLLRGSDLDQPTFTEPNQP
jgi:hypothetical protein